ncbi:TIGR00730 family Rossman fold protein [Vulgatibacter sp.]|uniref:LOG family protein n=1 Tax=Vulgatibacter sp. TaxID=1971226 RepID=UPI00356A5ED8
MAPIRSVCVFLGSSSAPPPPFHELARVVGAGIARAGLTLVYGGASVGLMGELADAALAAGGAVIGVIPRHLVDHEIAHPGLSEQVIVGSMHERKAVMAARSDAIAVLPGGFGTLDEAFEAITWRQLGLHDKPVIFVDPPGVAYWEPLHRWVEAAAANGLVRREHTALFERVEGADALFERLARDEAHPRPPPKWI